MRRLFLLALAALITGPAMADQAPARRVLKRPVVLAPVYSWSGFYIGAYGGQTRFESTDRLAGTPLNCNPFAVFDGADPLAECGRGGPGFITVLQAHALAVPDTLNTSGRGGTWGGTVGYNHQFYRQFVGGFEGDFGAARAAGSNISSVLSPIRINGDSIFHTGDAPNCCSITGHGWVEERMRYFGTLRARLGWLPWNPVLLYGTFGLAFAQISSSAIVTQRWNVDLGRADNDTCCVIFNPSFATAEKWRAGVTGGGGIEIALGAGLSIKGEYLYYTFGNWTYDLPAISGTPVPPACSPGVCTGPFTTIGLSATTRSFNGSRWIVGLNYKFDKYYAPVVTK
jgi:outer membrane immunogenic protein